MAFVTIYNAEDGLPVELEALIGSADVKVLDMPVTDEEFAQLMLEKFGADETERIGNMLIAEVRSHRANGMPTGRLKVVISAKPLK